MKLLLLSIVLWAGEFLVLGGLELMPKSGEALWWVVFFGLVCLNTVIIGAWSRQDELLAEARRR